MFLGKVVGTVWSTKKTLDLEGVKFLVVHPFDLDKEPNKSIIVCADNLGAGIGEIVMCAFGKAARSAIGDQEMSIEAAVIGIVDRVDLSQEIAKSDELIQASKELRGEK
jgi:ethanolamine utilization protein EutN